MSRDEVVGLFVALACAAGCVLFLLGLPTPALAEEPEEATQLVEGLAETLGETVQTGAPASSNPMPLIVVVVIMGVALAIAFVVSHSHNKPQKLGGVKGDVW